MHLKTLAFALAAASIVSASTCADDDVHLPFDFSDSFYLENGIDPTKIVGRPNGTPPGSVIDNTPNGPDFNNVRVLGMTAAYDDSGHPIFFYVTGIILSTDAFTNNSAGDEAQEIADEFKVYEFPRAANPLGAVFPKRQDLIADLSGGYFSNDPLGLWQVNIVKFTPAAFNTAEGMEALADLAADNGLDLDGTPIIRTKSEVENLVDDGFATIFIPPTDGSQGLRWFFCPVLKDPRDGIITPDAHLEVTEGIAAALEFEAEFECLQTTGDWCDGSSSTPCPADLNNDGNVSGADLATLLSAWGTNGTSVDLDGNNVVNAGDLAILLAGWGGCP